MRDSGDWEGEEGGGDASSGPPAPASSTTPSPKPTSQPSASRTRTPPAARPRARSRGALPRSPPAPSFPRGSRSTAMSTARRRATSEESAPRASSDGTPRASTLRRCVPSATLRWSCRARWPAAADADNRDARRRGSRSLAVPCPDHRGGGPRAPPDLICAATPLATVTPPPEVRRRGPTEDRPAPQRTARAAGLASTAVADRVPTRMAPCVPLRGWGSKAVGVGRRGRSKGVLGRRFRPRGARETRLGLCISRGLGKGRLAPRGPAKNCPEPTRRPINSTPSQRPPEKLLFGLARGRSRGERAAHEWRCLKKPRRATPPPRSSSAVFAERRLSSAKAAAAPCSPIRPRQPHSGSKWQTAASSRPCMLPRVLPPSTTRTTGSVPGEGRWGGPGGGSARRPRQTGARRPRRPRRRGEEEDARDGQGVGLDDPSPASPGRSFPTPISFSSQPPPRSARDRPSQLSLDPHPSRIWQRRE